MRKLLITHLTVLSCLFSQLIATAPTEAKRAGNALSSSSQEKLRKLAARTYPRTHFEKGLYFKQKADPDRALVEFLKATQENPRLVKAFYQQALIFRNKGYLKLAASALVQALAVNPSFQKARVLLATIRLEQGNVGSAAKELSRSLGLKKPVQTAAKPARPPKEVPPPSVMQMVHRALPVNTPKETGLDKTGKPALNPNLSGIPGFDPSVPHRIISSTFVSSLPAQTKSGKEPTETGRQDGSGLLSALSNPLSLIRPADKHHKKHSARKHKKGKKKKSWFKRMFSLRKSKDRRTAKKKKARKQMVKINKSSLPAGIDSRNKIQSSALIGSGITNNLPDGTKIAMVIRQPEATDSAQPAAKAGDVFSAPRLPSSEKRLLAMAGRADLPGTGNKPATAVKLLPLDGRADAWSKRMQYLVENGTRSLRAGEAFMFSEASGEGVLFLPRGKVIRRQIASPRDPSEIIQVRRPDIKSPSALHYQLSLLGRLLPKRHDPAPVAPITAQPPPAFSIDELLGEEAGFWGWLKGLFKF